MLRSNCVLVCALLLLLGTACVDRHAAKRAALERADSCFAQQKYDAAILQYGNAVKLDPRDGLVRKKLADAYMRRGDVLNALTESVRASDLLPDDIDAQLQTTILLISAGRFADARDRAAALSKRAPRNGAVRVALGNALGGLTSVDDAIARIDEGVRLGQDPIRSNTAFSAPPRTSASLHDAENAYRQALDVAPDYAPAHLALAQLYWSTNRHEDADRHVAEALRIAPRDVTVNRFAALIYQSSGRIEEAEPFLRTAATIDRSVRSRFALADYYVARGRTGPASDILSSLVKDEGIGRVAKARLAMTRYQAGQADAALRTAVEVLSDDSQNVEALVVKASVLFDRKQWNEALATIEAAIVANPASAPVHLARGRILAALGRREAVEELNQVLRLDPNEAAAQVELAKLYLADGAADTSVALAGAAVKLDPRRADARLILVRGLIATRQFLQAGAVLDELERTLPNDAIVHAQRGALAAARGQRAAAEAAFTRAVALDPLQIDANTGLIALDLARGQKDAAVARADALAARAPANGGVLALAGRTYLATGHIAAAERALKQSIAADAGAPGVHSLLGDVYLRQQKLDDARREFESAAGLDSKPVSALTMIGLIDQRQGRPDDARRAFERALQLNPRAAVPANNLAWIYLDEGGSLEMAVRLAKVAHYALPDNALVNDTLGWVYLKRGDVALATPALERAVRLDPSNASIQYHLGVAYAKAGNRAKAKEALTTALRLDPAFEGAADATRILGTL